MSTPKPWYSMKARASEPAVAEVYIYDEIGEFFGEGIGAKRFADDLAGLGKLDTINLYINSPGGDVWDGFAIYNTLAFHPAEKYVRIDSLAASIASVIAMAGDRIEIADSAWAMIHAPWTITVGNAVDHREQADLLEQFTGSIAGIYAKRTGMSLDEISGLIAGGEDVWLDADAAVRMGFADAKAKTPRMAASLGVASYKAMCRDLAARMKSQFRTADGMRLAELKTRHALASMAPRAGCDDVQSDDSKSQSLALQIADLQHFLHMNRMAHNHPLAK